MTIEETLWKEYEDIDSKLKVIVDDDNRTKSLIDERNNIKNQLIKLKEHDDEMDLKEKELLHNDVFKGVEIGKDIVTNSLKWFVILGIAAKSFDFEKDSSLTTTAGKLTISNIIQSLFRG